jgi:hypothetical protein
MHILLTVRAGSGLVFWWGSRQMWDSVAFQATSFEVPLLTIFLDSEMFLPYRLFRTVSREHILSRV